jgi:hypothetical protein
MNVEIRDDRFRSVVGGDVEIERLGTGFGFTEGPIWHPRSQHLIFSDMPGRSSCSPMISASPMGCVSRSTRSACSSTTPSGRTSACST